MEYDHVHMERDTMDVMEEPHVEDKYEENCDLYVFVNGYDIEYIGQALVLKAEEEDSSMGEIVEDMWLGSSRFVYLSKYWIYEYISEMKIQVYINIDHLGRILFDTSFIGKSCDKEDKSKMHFI